MNELNGEKKTTSKVAVVQPSAINVRMKLLHSSRCQHLGLIGESIVVVHRDTGSPSS